LSEIVEALDDCLLLYDYVNCVYWIFGISSEDAPAQNEMWQELQQLREKFAQSGRAGRRVVVTEPVKVLEGLRSIKESGEQNRQLWKNGPIKIVCSDDELRRIAQKVKEDGSVCLSKTEFDDRFDISAVDPFWGHVPDYTQVFLGWGFRLSSPEWDMFFAMCHSHDEAIRTGEELESVRQTIDSDEFQEVRYRSLHAVHFLHVRQVVVNACLFVEAFVNSVAHAYRCKPARPLSADDDRFLRERTLDKKTGAERERFVALQDKLHRWVQLVSPRGETFDKGTNPFQAFRTIQEYRDSIVHLSAAKTQTYHRLNLAVCTQATDAALDVVDAICRFIAPDPNVPARPKWLAHRQTDGLFHLSPRIDLASPTS
jgi:hypothetical protein